MPNREERRRKSNERMAAQSVQGLPDANAVSHVMGAATGVHRLTAIKAVMGANNGQAILLQLDVGGVDLNLEIEARSLPSLINYLLGAASVAGPMPGESQTWPVQDLAQTVRARASDVELQMQGDKLILVMRVGRVDLSVQLPAAAAVALKGLQAPPAR